MTTEHKCPGEVVISEFGGVRALARLANLEVVTIYRWRPWPRHDPQFNLEGRVPLDHFESLLALAKQHGKKLTLSDLVRGRG